jgi:hypothetical protein
MAYPDLPPSVKLGLAELPMRVDHHVWHLVRNPDYWHSLTPQEQANYAAEGWQAPRFHGTAGSGIDFLGMHRNMIPHVDHLMSQAGDPAWPKVIAWAPIPWSEIDADWPVPPSWPGINPGMASAKSAASAATNQQIADQLVDPTILRKVTIDDVGRFIEGSIHAWMHNRWSAAPTVDVWAPEPENDYLGAPYSSHVNKHFWKLHGWIDERIANWEAANDRQADLSAAWSGPTAHLMRTMSERVGSQARASEFIFREDPAIQQEILAIPRG